MRDGEEPVSTSQAPGGDQRGGPSEGHEEGASRAHPSHTRVAVAQCRSKSQKLKLTHATRAGGHPTAARLSGNALRGPGQHADPAALVAAALLHRRQELRNGLSHRRRGSQHQVPEPRPVRLDGSLRSIPVGGPVQATIVTVSRHVDAISALSRAESRGNVGPSTVDPQWQSAPQRLGGERDHRGNHRQPVAEGTRSAALRLDRRHWRRAAATVGLQSHAARGGRADEPGVKRGHGEGGDNAHKAQQPRRLVRVPLDKHGQGESSEDHYTAQKLVSGDHEEAGAPIDRKLVHDPS